MTTPELTLELMKLILAETTRHELVDHAFGDAEVSWVDSEDNAIASGYFGREASVTHVDSDVTFTGDEARALRKLGTDGSIERNDMTGPDQYVESLTMPGLTKAGVFEELTGTSYSDVDW